MIVVWLQIPVSHPKAAVVNRGPLTSTWGPVTPTGDPLTPQRVRIVFKPKAKYLQALNIDSNDLVYIYIGARVAQAV
jgi:hypothetical protein